jgi:hypothetical protein
MGVFGLGFLPFAERSQRATRQIDGRFGACRRTDYVYMILKGDILPSLSLQQKHEWAMAFLKMYSNGILVAKIFWGLWLIPLGLLFYKSGFMSRILGILLILGGIAYLIEVFTALIFPDYRSFVSQFTSIAVAIPEISTTFWLLIKGVKEVKEN